MSVKPDDHPELTESLVGYVIRPKRIDYSRLGTLRSKIPQGVPPFDIGKFRETLYGPALRGQFDEDIGG